MIDVRVFYKKYGRAIYISHLDLNRLMQRALARAKLPVWFTQGFNPHLYLTFPLPLSLGVTGLCETMDFRLTKELSFNEVKTVLNKVLPEGIKILRVSSPVNKPEAIAKSGYEILLNAEGLDKQKMETHLNSREIMVDKKTKKGIKTIDIKPFLFMFSCKDEENDIKVSLTLPAGGQNNINPGLIIDNFLRSGNYHVTKYNLTRTGVMLEDGSLFC